MVAEGIEYPHARHNNEQDQKGKHQVSFRVHITHINYIKKTPEIEYLGNNVDNVR